MSQLFYLPFRPVFNSRGLPVGGAKVYFYKTGTTTLATVYADGGLTTPLTNPVPADALGQLPDIYMPDDVIFRVRIVDRKGLALGSDIDPYYPGQALVIVPDLPALIAADGASKVGYQNGQIGANTRTVQAELRDLPFNPKDFGAIGDAQYHPLSERFTTLSLAQAVYPFATRLDQSLDWAGIQAALNAAASNENVRGIARLPLGYYVLTDSLRLPSFVTFEGASRHGSILYNQVRNLNAPMIVNKDAPSLVFSTVRNMSIFGGTHAIKISVSVETASLVFEALNTAFQTVSVLEANSLQTTKFQDCAFGPAGSGYAVNVTGFPCNAIEFYNCRVSSGAKGVLRLRGFDGVHWYGGSMEGNGRSLKTTGTIAGTVLNITALNDGIGPITPGDAVIGEGVTPGTVIVSLGSGSGGTGGYIVSLPSTFGPGPLVIGPSTIDLEAGGTRATSITFNGVYFEGTPRCLLRSIGVQGLSFDACKHTWASFGEPYIYDTGTDIVAVGTNYFDTNVIGPLNTLMFGASPQMGGNVNTWTQYGQNSGRVVTRQRDIIATPTFDLLKFNRATATSGSDNMHLITGTLTVLAQGYDAAGLPRSINRTYRVVSSAISNTAITATITQIDTQDNISGTSPQTLVARIKGTPGVTEMIVEVATTNFDGSNPACCSATFEYAGRPTNPADMMRVSVL